MDKHEGDTLCTRRITGSGNVTYFLTPKMKTKWLKIVVRVDFILVRLQVVSSTAAGWRVGGQAGWQADRSGWLRRVGSSSVWVVGVG